MSLGKSVGWVKRSATHQCMAQALDGLRRGAANPSYKACATKQVVV